MDVITIAQSPPGVRQRGDQGAVSPRFRGLICVNV
jgi:hypothetical protein